MDMTSEVIRVERPGGEEDRTVGLRASNGECLSYPSLNRNKKGITLELLRNPCIGQALMRTHHRFHELVALDFTLGIDDHLAGHAQTINPRI